MEPRSAGYSPLPSQAQSQAPGRDDAVLVNVDSDGQTTGRLWRDCLCPVDEVFQRLGCTASGLTHEEAARRLAAVGPNVLAAAGPPRWPAVLWPAAVHPFNAILLFLAAAAIATGDRPGAGIMLAMVLLSTSLRFWQEMRSTVAAAALTGLVTTRAKVLRRQGAASLEPEEVDLDHRQVVPGDIVRLYAGELFPGDVRLLQARDLYAGEATLTGESMPVEKVAALGGAAPPRGAGLLGARTLGFMGTHVVSGAGLGVVVATGRHTYISSVAGALRAPGTNAFQRGVRRVSYLLIAFMVVAVPLVVAIQGSVTGNWYQAALFGVSVAVGLTPELLPLVVNVNLARGAVELARQRAIVKRLDAVQNLGAADTVCLDKTGTLTLDEVVLMRWLDWRGQDGGSALRWAWLNSHFQTGLRNLLDNAILREGEEHGLSQSATDFRLVDELPFDFVRRRLSVILAVEGPAGTPGGAALLVCKGALDELVPLCCQVEDGDQLLPLDETARAHLSELGASMNQEGLRVLGVAVKAMPCLGAALAAAAGEGGASGRSSYADDSGGSPAQPSSVLASQKQQQWGNGAAADAGCGVAPPQQQAQQAQWSTGDEAGLTFIGFLAFLDPPKDSARQAVAALQSRSVGLKVLTGDALPVACKVCREVGIPADDTLTGPELDKLSPVELQLAVGRATVLARLDPLQKARVVGALQAAGHTVAFLGDGINDTLALRRADVGVSVDTGSDIAKETADVILLEKSLLTLARGVEGGRSVHGNTLKYIKMAASSNFGNVLSILVASAWLPFQPITPLQLLTQNLLYDLSQVAIPFDRMDPSYLEVPRPWDAATIGLFMIAIGPISSIFDITTFVVLWKYYGANSPAHQALFQTGWFTLGILTQTLVVHVIRTERTPLLSSIAAPPLVITSLAVAALGLVTPYTLVGAVEGLVALPASFYGVVAATTAAYFLTVQLAKVAYIRLVGSWL